MYQATIGPKLAVDENKDTIVTLRIEMRHK